MYSVQSVQVNREDELYAYCDTVTHLTNNLENATLFRIRQCMTAVTKQPSDRTDNENEVLDELKQLTALGKYQMPEEKKWMLSYELLDALYKLTDNPDYFAEGLPRQTAQNAVKTMTRNMKAFFKAIKAYSKDPTKFTGRPKLPGYHHSGGNCTALLSNQDCVVKDGAVKLPLTGVKCRIGAVDGKLKQATITPYHDVFILRFTFETKEEPPVPVEHPVRIVSLDLGVDNLAAMTNNIGEACLLFKGGIVKSDNQLYNRQIARIMSQQTKGTSDKFVPTEEYHRITLKRNHRIDDFFHKTAKRIMMWCLEYEIDTIIIGHNDQWKQESDMGSINNQNFVQIPFNDLILNLCYLAERYGINVIQHEESYTSKASFLDRDELPVYQTENQTVYQFSGTRYSRGMYHSKDGTEINADLNGSANIGRKAIPDMYQTGKEPDFSNVITIIHPDRQRDIENRNWQLGNQRTGYSKSKQNRMYRKSKVALLG